MELATATESLDEWLVERRSASEVQQPDTEITPEPCTTSPLPTAETIQSQVASEPVAVALAEVDKTEEGAAD